MKFSPSKSLVASLALSSSVLSVPVRESSPDPNGSQSLSPRLAAVDIGDETRSPQLNNFVSQSGKGRPPAVRQGSSGRKIIPRFVLRRNSSQDQANVQENGKGVGGTIKKMVGTVRGLSFLVREPSADGGAVKPAKVDDSYWADDGHTHVRRQDLPLPISPPISVPVSIPIAAPTPANSPSIPGSPSSAPNTVAGVVTGQLGGLPVSAPVGIPGCPLGAVCGGSTGPAIPAVPPIVSAIPLSSVPSPIQVVGTGTGVATNVANTVAGSLSGVAAGTPLGSVISVVGGIAPPIPVKQVQDTREGINDDNDPESRDTNSGSVDPAADTDTTASDDNTGDQSEEETNSDADNLSPVAEGGSLFSGARVVDARSEPTTSTLDPTRSTSSHQSNRTPIIEGPDRTLHIARDLSPSAQASSTSMDL